ncbi:MAG TPA: RNA polymerase sigma-54 factor, partial [Nitrospirae bacterium]|nr:RNA polymerase sigma-54 factor [Nitrospirota bacterium]
MAHEQKLELRLSQRLILTPQLQQSIRLLQLPLLELTQDINQKLMNNPMLEEGPESESEPKQETTVGSSEEAPYKESSNDIEAPLEKIFGFTTDNYF